MIVECPHCQDTIIIESINCGIFRHGVLKADGKQIDPHLPQDACENYFRNNLIFGCGKPFQIIENKVHVCGYY
jgi:hypothetical protein